MTELNIESVGLLRQKLVDSGFHPLEALNRTKHPFGSGWTRKPSCLDVHPERLSTALLAKGVWIIDVDTEDPILANQILEFSDSAFGVSVKRLRTNTSRFALIYQGFGKPSIPKISLGKDGMIDILGAGRCIMVGGEHKDQAGSYYYMERLVPRDQLATIKNEDINALQDRFARDPDDHDLVNEGRTVDGRIPEGGRNDSLFREACRLQHNGVPEELRRANLRLINESIVEKPLDDDELEAIVQSSGRYPPSVIRGSALAPSSKRFAATDVGVMERFRHLLGAERKIVPELSNQWFEWREFIWAPIRSIQDDLINVIRSMQAEIGIYPDRSEELRKYLKTSENASKIKTISNLISNDDEIIITAAQLDAVEGLVGCRTAVVDLEAASEAPVTPENWITKQCNADFDIAASSPAWIDFVNQIFAGNQDVISYVQKALGMAVGHGNKEQIMLLLYGTGANGKSVFLKVVQEIFGDYAKQVSPETLTDSKKAGGGAREDLIRLRGCRLLVTSETEEHDTLAAGLIKSLTGGDLISARAMYSTSSIEFTIKALPILATNHLPKIRDTSDGMWRRLKPIRMGVTIPVENRDPDLVRKLLEERNGIFNWIIEGAQAYLRDGLDTPLEIVDEVMAYRSESDVLQAWINDSCQLESSQYSDLGSLFAEYQLSLLNDGAKPLSKRRFLAVLRERFKLESRKSNGRTIIDGIVLNKVERSALLAPTVPCSIAS